MKKLLRRLLLWALQPELQTLKLHGENIDIVRNPYNQRITALEQRFNSVLPAIEQWYGYGPAKWCDETKKELKQELAYLRDHVEALKDHRVKHEVRLQNAEDALRKAGRL